MYLPTQYERGTFSSDATSNGAGSIRKDKWYEVKMSIHKDVEVLSTARLALFLGLTAFSFLTLGVGIVIIVSARDHATARIFGLATRC